MPKGSLDPREMGFYFALAQAGLEMVAPMGIGIALDAYFGWTPKATVTGFIFGFVGGFIHLIILLKEHDAREQKRRSERDGNATGG